MATKKVKPTLATSTAELSGVQWIKRFSASTNIKDLTPSFRKAVEAFVDAMTAAGVKVRISSTYRSLEGPKINHIGLRPAAKGGC